MEYSLQGIILMRMYDADGNYIGNPSRKIMTEDGLIDIDEYAEEHGFSLPDSE